MTDWRGHAALWVEDSESGRDGQREALGVCGGLGMYFTHLTFLQERTYI